MDSNPEIKPPKVPGWVKKVIPALISAGILSYYLRGQDWGQLREACLRANLGLAVLAVVIPQLVQWFLGTLIVERQFKWFHGPFPFRGYFWVRGGAYILFFVNNALGGSGLLLYQKLKGRITWRKLMGLLLFRVGVGFGWGMMFVMIPATIALHHYGLAAKANLNLQLWWGILLLPGLLFLISTWLFWFYQFDPVGLGAFIVRDHNDEFWTAFRAARPRHWILTWIMSVPSVLVLVAGFYVLSLAFHMKIPAVEFMVVMPLALMVIDLPVAFAGFGTATMAWMLFFGDYASEQDIVALTLFFPFCRTVCRLLIGVFSLRPALKEINSLFRADQEAVPAGA